MLELKLITQATAARLLNNYCASALQLRHDSPIHISFTYQILCMDNSLWKGKGVAFNSAKLNQSISCCNFPGMAGWCPVKTPWLNTRISRPNTSNIAYNAQTVYDNGIKYVLHKRGMASSTQWELSVQGANWQYAGSLPIPENCCLYTQEPWYYFCSV